MAFDLTEREARVLAAFRQILGAPELGPEDNFFELGGSSLLAARLASRLRNTGVLDVSTAAIFDAPTARALTRYVAVHSDQSASAPVASSAAERGARQRAAFARLRSRSTLSKEA
jgi:Phosphopantetheine attachment site